MVSTYMFCMITTYFMVCDSSVALFACPSFNVTLLCSPILSGCLTLFCVTALLYSAYNNRVSHFCAAYPYSGNLSHLPYAMNPLGVLFSGFLTNWEQTTSPNSQVKSISIFHVTIMLKRD